VGGGAFRSADGAFREKGASFRALAVAGPSTLVFAGRKNSKVYSGRRVDGSTDFEASVIAEENNVLEVTVADLRGRGVQDIMIATKTRVKVMEATAEEGDVTWAAPTTLVNKDTSRQDSIHGVECADVDGDGNMDVVITAQRPRGSVKWFTYPDGDETIIRDNVRGAHYTLLADADDDGDVDGFVCSDKFSFSLLQNPGGGSGEWPATNVDDGEGSRYACYEDVDGDGIKDAVVTFKADDRFKYDADAALGWFKGLGDGAFGPKNILLDWSFNRGMGVVCADLDNDGDVDIAVALHRASAIAFLENNGSKDADTLFEEPNVTNFDSNTCIKPGLLVALDYDTDGQVDLATNCRDSDTIIWLRNESV